VGGYTFVNEGGERGSDAHKMFVGVRLGVFRDGDRVGTLSPSVNVYRADGQRSTEVAIDTGPARDVYVVLAGLTPDGLARFSVFLNPLVMWLWVAGILVALGALVAVWPAPRTVREPAPADAGARRAA
jgi:cytochrome c-type biogenesis protein CcmF